MQVPEAEAGNVLMQVAVAGHDLLVMAGQVQACPARYSLP